jgi:hypothetical protein
MPIGYDRLLDLEDAAMVIGFQKQAVVKYCMILTFSYDEKGNYV